MKQAVLIGCGAMAAGWLKALAEPGLVGRVRIAALVDIDRGAAEKLKVQFGLSEAITSSDLARTLTDLKPDIVFDVAVPAARKDIVLTALAHGCHVLTEKPMATSLADAEEMNAAAERSGRVYAVTQNRRFSAGVRRIRAAIESGLLGEVNAIHSDFFVGAHFGGFRDAMQHVLLLDMAIHTFDKARFITGKDPQAVYCLEGNPPGSWYAHGSVANAIFELADGVVFTYRGAWSAEGANTSWDSSWRIVGSKGTLLWDGEAAITARVVAGDEGFFRPLEDVEIPPPADPGQTAGHVSVIASFLDAIDSGTAPETSGRDNIKSLAMVLAAIESAETGQRVVINAMSRT